MLYISVYSIMLSVSSFFANRSSPADGQIGFCFWKRDIHSEVAATPFSRQPDVYFEYRRRAHGRPIQAWRVKLEEKKIQKSLLNCQTTASSPVFMASLCLCAPFYCNLRLAIEWLSHWFRLNYHDCFQSATLNNASQLLHVRTRLDPLLFY